MMRHTRCKMCSEATDTEAAANDVLHFNIVYKRILFLHCLFVHVHVFCLYWRDVGRKLILVDTVMC